MFFELLGGIEHTLVCVATNIPEFAAGLGRCSSGETADEHLTAIAWVLDPYRRHVLLASHRTHGWSCPGGHVEHGEQPGDAALRELAEETGVESAPVVPHPVTLSRAIGCARQPDRPITHWTLGYLFVVPMDAALQAEPGQPLQWFPVDELPTHRPNDLDVVLPVLSRAPRPR